MLDQDYGFFPHVTWSKTGCRNLTEDATPDQIMYVTRAYQTRHGAGPTFGNPITVNNPDETNTDEGYQGEFRIRELDIDLLKYALECDALSAPPTAEKNLVITCVDQIEYKLPIDVMYDKLGVDNIYLCNSPECKNLTKTK